MRPNFLVAQRSKNPWPICIRHNGINILRTVHRMLHVPYFPKQSPPPRNRGPWASVIAMCYAADAHRHGCLSALHHTVLSPSSRQSKHCSVFASFSRNFFRTIFSVITVIMSAKRSAYSLQIKLEVVKAARETTIHVAAKSTKFKSTKPTVPSANHLLIIPAPPL